MNPLKNEVRQYIKNLLLTKPEFGAVATQDYQAYLDAGPNEETSHVMVGYFGQLWADNQDPAADTPYWRIRAIMHDNSYPEEEFVSLELNSEQGDEIAELFYLKIETLPGENGNYTCELRHPDNFGETENFEISRFSQLREYLQEFTSNIN